MKSCVGDKQLLYVLFMTARSMKKCGLDYRDLHNIVKQRKLRKKKRITIILIIISESSQRISIIIMNRVSMTSFKVRLDFRFMWLFFNVYTSMLSNGTFF